MMNIIKSLSRVFSSLLFSFFQTINNEPAPTLMPTLIPTLIPTHEPTLMPTHEPTRHIMWDSSFTSAVQHFYFFELSRDDVAFFDAADTCGCAGENEVSGLEQIELAGVGDDLIDSVNHVTRPAHLSRLSVKLHREMQVLHILSQHLGKTEPLLTAISCAIKPFGNLPWQAFLRQLSLDVACREVDAECYFVVVAVGKTLGNGFAEAVDAYHQFSLVFYLLAPIGYEERPVGAGESGVGFEEKGDASLLNGRLWHTHLHTLYLCQGVFQFLVMFGIIHAYADYLHAKKRLLARRFGCLMFLSAEISRYLSPFRCLPLVDGQTEGMGAEP